MPKNSKRKANEIVKDNKRQNNHASPISALEFFYTKVYPLVHNWKKEEREEERTKAIEVITNADAEFKRKNPSIKKNFWILLDDELFSQTKESIELLRELNKSRENFKLKNNAIQQGLGFLSITASRGVALDRKVFDSVIEVYKKAYEEKNDKNSLLLRASNERNSNVLHIVCSIIVSIADELGIEKENWEVYEFLVKEHPDLLQKKDQFDRTPNYVLEENDIEAGRESRIEYACYVGE